MQDTAFNMLFAGHDTTASALTLMMRYLKQEPRVLQKVRDEQHQVTPSRLKTNTKFTHRLKPDQPQHGYCMVTA